MKIKLFSCYTGCALKSFIKLNCKQENHKNLHFNLNYTSLLLYENYAIKKKKHNSIQKATFQIFPRENDFSFFLIYQRERSCFGIG